MDYEIDFNSKSLAFFSNELIDLMQRQDVKLYLKKLSGELSQAATSPDAEFNLWLWSLNYFKNDRAITESVITVLFQDHVAQYHVNWLRHVHAHGETTEALAKVLSQLQNQDLLKRVNFYPQAVTAEMKTHFNEKIYYYTIPKRIVGSLVRTGTDASVARRWVLYVMLTYKTLHHYKSYKKAWMNPHPFIESHGLTEMSEKDQQAWRYRIRDIYMGYVAIQLRPKNFDDFCEGLVSFRLIK